MLVILHSMIQSVPQNSLNLLRAVNLFNPLSSPLSPLLWQLFLYLNRNMLLTNTVASLDVKTTFLRPLKSTNLSIMALALLSTAAGKGLSHVKIFLWRFTEYKFM